MLYSDERLTTRTLLLSTFDCQVQWSRKPLACSCFETPKSEAGIQMYEMKLTEERCHETPCHLEGKAVLSPLRQCGLDSDYASLSKCMEAS